MEQRSIKKFKLSASALKTIAVVLMLINHICVLFMNKNDNGSLYDIIIAVTRASFVIFAFLLAEGMVHTRSREKYLCRLFVFAVISEIPFDLFAFGKVLEFSRQNVFFELAVAGLGIYLIDKYREGYIKVLIGAAIIALATVIRADYSYMGIALVFVFYYLRDKKIAMFLAAAAVLFLGALPSGISAALIQLCGAWSFILMAVYDGTRGNQLPAMLYYWFYPVHLMLLWLISLMVG